MKLKWCVFDDTIIVEICAGEGGTDSKLFVNDLLSAYEKYAKSKGLKSEQLDYSFGHVMLKVTGKGAGRAFRFETGQHVVQRIPPTEHNGRKQTSCISVAVLPLPPEHTIKPLPQNELEITPTKGTGPGGQNKNKVESAIRAKHKPTGIEVFIDGRDQFKNKCFAIRILTVKVNELYNGKKQADYNANRKEKLGNGGRGTKIRTYNFLESRVADHRTGKKTSNVKEVMKGNFSLILD